MGLLLFLISVILLYLLSIPLMVYSLLRVSSFKEAGDYFFELAKSIDQFGNALGKYIFNDLFVSKGGYRFGDIDETISSVTGRNYQANTLTPSGKLFRVILDKAFGKDHCINSIGERKQNT